MTRRTPHLPTQQPQPVAPGDLIDEYAAAEILGVAVATLRGWRCRPPREPGPAYVRIGTRVRYRQGDLAAYVASRTVGV